MDVPGGLAFTSTHCYMEAYAPDFKDAFLVIHELKAPNLIVTIQNLDAWGL